MLSRATTASRRASGEWSSGNFSSVRRSIQPPQRGSFWVAAVVACVGGALMADLRPPSPRRSVAQCRCPAVRVGRGAILNADDGVIQLLGQRAGLAAIDDVAFALVTQLANRRDNGRR